MPITTRIPSGILITPPAQLTREVARYFRQEVLALAPECSHDVAIDLSGVDQVDADGLSALVGLHDALAPRALIVVEPSEVMQGELERVRLFEIFDIHYQRDTLLTGTGDTDDSVSREVA